MLVQNADTLNYEQERIYHINRITFGYTRIYEPASDSKNRYPGSRLGFLWRL